ncbi:MAG: adenylate/guanylate cyclase domain-containing protein, partial [Deltaproteobacteria bacterium]|nr:adenylate/guanylate cyclase domain-containing protein [Deltaproteobacteria bacterium]
MSVRHPLAVGVIFAIAASALYGLDRRGGDRAGVGEAALDRFELPLLDARFERRGPLPARPDVVVVVVDDRTIAAAPKVFEQRAMWARLITAIREGGARAIGVDLFFHDPERPLDALLQADIQAYVEAHADLAPESDRALELLRRVHAETQGDALLAEAIADAGNVVLAMDVDASGAGGDVSGLAKGKYGQVALGTMAPPPATRAIASLPLLNAAARRLGSITVSEVRVDRTMRHLVMARRLGQSAFAPMAVQLVALAEQVDRSRLVYDGAHNTVRIGPRAVALDSQHGILLNYRGPAHTFATYSAIDVLEHKLPAAALDGKIVVLGLSYFGHDTARTAFGASFPAVELHATAVDNILGNDPLRRAPWWVDALVCLGIGLAMALLFGLRLPGLPWSQLGGALAVVVVYYGASFWLFAQRQLWLTWFAPLCCAVVVASACSIVAYLSEGLQRRRLRRAFSHYLDDAVIAQLVADPNRLRLGGERRELTVLFSDIRSFTSLSEKLEPEALVHFLNAYLTPMTDAVLRCQGYLDKYVGDAVMAVFGAPVGNPEHADAALRAVLEMHRELDAMRPRWLARGIDLRIGVGVNTGEMVVGNMGSARHFDYTVIGDAVNLASRLEGL